MKLWAGLARWASQPGKVSRASGPDPADMGTAFGLDASFEHVRDAAPRPATAKVLRPSWDFRLVRRPQR